MAAVSVVAAEVLPIANVTYVAVDGIAGATIIAGQSIYLDSSTTTWKLSQADGTAAEANCTGIAACGGGNGQPIKVYTAGAIDPGFTSTVGETYVLGAAAGSIYPVADLISSDYVSILGIGITASRIDLLFKNSGVEKP